MVEEVAARRDELSSFASRVAYGAARASSTLESSSQEPDAPSEKLLIGVHIAAADMAGEELSHQKHAVSMMPVGAGESLSAAR